VRGVGARICVHSPASPPRSWSRRAVPCPARASAASSASSSRAPWPRRPDAGCVIPAPPSGRARPPASGPACAPQAIGQRSHDAIRPRRGFRRRADRPGTGRGTGQRAPRRDPTAPVRPAGARERSVGHSQVAGAGQRQFLHARDIGVAVRQAAFLRGRERRGHRFRRQIASNGEIGRAPGGPAAGSSPPAPEVGPKRARPDRGQPARRPRPARGGKRDRGANQPVADHHRRCGKGVTAAAMSLGRYPARSAKAP